MPSGYEQSPDYGGEPPTWRTYLGALVFFACAASLGIAGSYMRWKRPPTDHTGYRWTVILEQATQIPEGGSVIIGDSLVERQYLATLCGAPALNAGIGSATTREFTGNAGQLYKALRNAKRVVIGLGANDALRVPVPEYAANLRAIAGAFQGSDLAIVGVPDAPDYDRAASDTAREIGAVFVPYAVPKSKTIDGLHLTAEGASIWQDALHKSVCR